MTRKFQRTTEDFTCGNCGLHVHGTGYTNHCPQCLWSRHVDIHPGDRAADCSGLMPPIAVEKQKDGYRILHSCLACGHERWNKTAPEDDFEVLLQIAAESQFAGDD